MHLAPHTEPSWLKEASSVATSSKSASFQPGVWTLDCVSSIVSIAGRLRV